MLLLWCSRVGRSFRAPAAPESLFSEWPEKSNPKRGHPVWRLPGVAARQVREPGAGFSTAHPCADEKAAASCRRPLARPVAPASPPRRGLKIKSRKRRAAYNLARRNDGDEVLASRASTPLCGECGVAARPAGGSAGSRSLFVGTWTCRRKAKPRRTIFSPGHGRKAPSGVPLSLVTFSRASERK